MEIKNCFRITGFIVIVISLLFGSLFFYWSKSRAMEYSRRDAEIRAAIEGLAESSYGIGESISNSISTVELIERIAERERAIRAAEIRNRESIESRVGELEDGIIQGQGILSGLSDSIIGGTGQIGDLSYRIGKAAEKAEEYEELIYSLGINISY